VAAMAVVLLLPAWDCTSYDCLVPILITKYGTEHFTGVAVG